MQTQADRELAAPSGATQTPLLRADQLRVGVILTGPAWSTARLVDRIEGGNAMLHRLPLGTQAQDPAHRHVFNLHSNVECACGYRREPLTGLVPLRDGLARTYIITTTEPLISVDPFTIYLMSRGRLAVGPEVGENWPVPLPLIPTLEPVWTLPEPLRAMMMRE